MVVCEYRLILVIAAKLWLKSRIRFTHSRKRLFVLGLCSMLFLAGLDTSAHSLVKAVTKILAHEAIDDGIESAAKETHWANKDCIMVLKYLFM